MSDVIEGTFPGPAESSHMDSAVLEAILGQGQLDRPEMVESSAGIPLDRDL